MKLSVIIPLYNCERFIGRCLDSVLKQQLDPGDELQVIVIDDGSTDRSGEIADEYAMRYSVIQVIHQSNQGVSVARNHGLEVADGDYIHFVDGDDFLLYDNCYQVLLKLIKLETNPVDILRFNMVTLYENHQIKIDEFYNLDHVAVKYEGSGKEICNQLHFIGYACTSLNRTSLLKERNIRFNPDVKLSEDALFYLELYNYAKHVIITDASVYGYYKHSESVTYTHDKKRLQRMVENLFDSLPPTVAALDLFDDPRFKAYRMESHGIAIAELLFRANLSYGKTKEYIKRGRDKGVFPIGVIHQGRIEKYMDKWLKSPLLFWLISSAYKHVYVSIIKKIKG